MVSRPVPQSNSLLWIGNTPMREMGAAPVPQSESSTLSASGCEKVAKTWCAPLYLRSVTE